jgi:hypothetical protein
VRQEHVFVFWKTCQLQSSVNCVEFSFINIQACHIQAEYTHKKLTFASCLMYEASTLVTAFI